MCTNSPAIFPSDVFFSTIFLPIPDCELIYPGYTTNSNYVDIMDERAKLIQTAKEINKKTYDVFCRKSNHQKKVTKQTEYSIVTAEGQTRYFFVQPERILCQENVSIYTVHKHFTSFGKPVFVPEDYLTNPAYRSPSPLPFNDVPKLVSPVDVSPPSEQISKADKPEEISISTNEALKIEDVSIPSKYSKTPAPSCANLFKSCILL
jgi:hypothetical protein